MSTVVDARQEVDKVDNYFFGRADRSQDIGVSVDESRSPKEVT